MSFTYGEDLSSSEWCAKTLNIAEYYMDLCKDGEGDNVPHMIMAASKLVLAENHACKKGHKRALELMIRYETRRSSMGADSDKLKTFENKVKAALEADTKRMEANEIKAKAKATDTLDTSNSKWCKKVLDTAEANIALCVTGTKEDLPYIGKVLLGIGIARNFACPKGFKRVDELQNRLDNTKLMKSARKEKRIEDKETK